MAGTVTQTVTKTRFEGTNVYYVDIAWTASSSDGSVPDTAFNTAVMNKIEGSYLFLIKTIPGTTAPTANYDITLVDSDGLDVLQGAGNNRSATVIETAVPKQDTGQSIYGPVYVPLPLTFKLANNSVHSATGVARFCFA